MRIFLFLILLAGALLSCGKSSTDTVEPGSYFYMTTEEDSIGQDPVEIGFGTSVTAWDGVGYQVAIEFAPILPPSDEAYYRVWINLLVGGELESTTCLPCNIETNNVYIFLIRPQQDIIVYRGETGALEICIHQLHFYEDPLLTLGLPAVESAFGELHGQLVTEDGVELKIGQSEFRYWAY